MTTPADDPSQWTDGRHPEALVEEWVFAAWTADARLGVISGHRIVDRIAWYWAALARADRPLLHITDFAVPVRADPFILKGEAMWAEHFRDAPMEQWSIGNETYASSIDDADEALGRAYGDPTPIGFDLEWYATAPPTPLTAAERSPLGAESDGGGEVDVTDGRTIDGYEQVGVVHGAIDVLGESRLELSEIPAHRWHRWTTAASRSLDVDGAPGTPDRFGMLERTDADNTSQPNRPARSAPTRGTRGDAVGPSLGPIFLPEATAHTGVRAPFAFPDGSVIDAVLTTRGWARRRRR